MSYFGINVDEVTPRGAFDEELPPVKVRVQKLDEGEEDKKALCEVAPGTATRIQFVSDRGAEKGALWDRVAQQVRTESRAMLIVEDEQGGGGFDAEDDVIPAPNIVHTQFNLYLNEPQNLIAELKGGGFEYEVDKRIFGKKMLENWDIQRKMLSRPESVIWEMVRGALKENTAYSLLVYMFEDASKVVRVRWRHDEWVVLVAHTLNTPFYKTMLKFPDDWVKPKVDGA